MRMLTRFWLACSLWLTVVTVFGQDVPSPEDLPSFLKEMERKAAGLNAKEAKWVRRDFSYAMKADGVGQERQQQAIAFVRALEANRCTFGEAVLGYMHGARVLLQRQDWSTWDAWHAQLQYFLDHPKERKAAQNLLSASEGLHAQGLLFASNASTWYLRDGAILLRTGPEGRPEMHCASGVLVCLSKGDSMRIREVEGVFKPMDNRFFGTSAKVDWERTNNAGDLEAELGSFEIRMKGSSFTTDQSRLRSKMFDLPLEGELSMKVQKEDKLSRRTYPRFESRTGRVTLVDVFPGIDYDGGLQVRGSKLSGTGSDGQWARLDFRHADSLFIRCWSDQVLFSDQSLDATHAKLALYLGEDSIVHPDIKIKYLHDGALFRATRQTDGVGQQPFLDSYHAVEMEVEAMEWSLGSPKVEFRRLTSDRPEPGAFRSLACFERDVYDEMMGIDPIHPLAELARYMAQRGVDSFYSEEYADFLGLQEEQARMLLIGLTNAGYVDLDLATRYCQVKSRAQRHIKCRKGVIDHDVLAFYSRPTDVVNATLSLSNKRLALHGIGRFGVSDAQDVKIIPRGGELALGKNRDFDFDGIVQAGKFELSGQDFAFNYNEFKLEVKQAESLRIQAEVDGKFDRYGAPLLRWVESTIEEITGTLAIDHPNNKSGWRSDFHTQYPILTSREVAHVYYDARRIRGGAYHRNRFNYAVDPFVIDSLDNFQKKDLTFTGELLAGGIVPDILEPLRLMEDYSLGFTKSTPAGGFPLYGDVAQVQGDLTLNLGGLHGPGKIDFLSSYIEGDDHVLLPDSTFGRTTLYTNTAVAGRVPSVDANVVDFGLHPSYQQLDVRSTPLDSLQFFGEDVRLVGGMHLRGQRMTGEGVFHFERAELSSRDFLMEERTIDADESAFLLQGTDLNEVAFGTDNVSAHVDFDARKGDFKALDGATLIDLPAIRYQCLMDEFSWFMDEERLDLRNTLIDPEAMTFQELADKGQSNFYSQHADQDGLHFLSPEASYKVDDAFVTCTRVQSIAVADAEIKPGDGVVVVRRDAIMDELYNAEVFANDVTRYHRLFDAKIQINGRLSYEGAASKTYLDAQGIEWPIRFNDLSVDTARRTIGHGIIRGEEEFFLSPHFAFKGRVHLEAGREDLAFEGGAQMQFECEDYAQEWVEFQGVIDPKDVALPIDSTVTELGKSHLGVGWTYNDGGISSLYPTFFTAKPIRSDRSFFVPRGKLRYDKRKDRYVLCSDEKLRNKDVPGNLAELSKNGCELNQQGRGSFPIVDRHLLEQEFIGDLFVKSGQMGMRGGLAMDMPIPDVLLKHLQSQIDASDNASALDWNATNYPYMLNEWVGMDATAELLDELEIHDGYKKTVPKAVRHSLVLHGMEWVFDPFLKEWVSEGNLAIATMGELSVFRTMRGKVVVDRDDQTIEMYIHLTTKHWYYFKWNAKQGYFRMQSREPEVEGEASFESLFADLKDGEKKVTQGKGQFVMQWLNPNSRDRGDFVDQFREFDE